MAENVIELASPLYLAIGGVTYRVHIISNANHILMRDGTDVETRINTLERGLAANTTMRFAEDIASRDALSGLAPGDCCHVTDATADATVARGGALYIWLPSLQWKKICNIDLPLDCFKVIAERGGLAVDGDGKMYVDFANLSQELKKRNAEALLRANDCLAADDAGRIWLDVAKISFAALTDAQKKQIMGGKAILQLDFSQMSEAQKRELLAGLSVTYLDFSKLTDGQISDILGDDHVEQIDFCQLKPAQITAILGGDNVQQLDLARLTGAQRTALMGGEHIQDLDFSKLSEKQKKELVGGDTIVNMNFSQITEEQKTQLFQGDTVKHLNFTQISEEQKTQITQQVDPSKFTTTQKTELVKSLDLTKITETQKTQITQSIDTSKFTETQKTQLSQSIDTSKFTETQKTQLTQAINMAQLTETQKTQLLSGTTIQKLDMGQLSAAQKTQITRALDPAQFTSAQQTTIMKAIGALLLKENGGLVREAATGKIYVDFTSMDAAIMRNVVLNMVAANQGLAVNSAGKIYVDFESMPQSTRENIQKAIRVPIWLTANKTFYVDKKHANASDAVNGEANQGRGETADKPFASIQACVNYVTENYNINSRTATILVKSPVREAGTTDTTYDYRENLVLPDYSRTSGQIILKGENWDKRFVLNTSPALNTAGDAMTAVPRGLNVSGGKWRVEDIQMKIICTFDRYTAISGTYNAFYVHDGAILDLYRHGVGITLQGKPKNSAGAAVTISMSCYYVDNGRLNLHPADVSQYPAASNGCPSSIGITLQGDAGGTTNVNTTKATLMTVAGGGQLRFTAANNGASTSYNGDINVYGSFSTVANISNGSVTVAVSESVNNDAVARFVGAKLNCDIGQAISARLSTGGKLSFGKNWNGEFMPGNQTFIVEKSSYSWLKPAQTGATVTEVE